MPNRNQIQEQYEEALFALLMDDVAEEEGRELLKRAETLNRDTNATVPDDLDQKCRKIIGKAGQKERWEHARRWTVKTLRRVVMVAILAGMLFAVAYATIPEVRVGVRNLILTVNEDSTDLSVRPERLSEEEKEDSPLYCYSLPGISPMDTIEKLSTMNHRVHVCIGMRQRMEIAFVYFCNRGQKTQTLESIRKTP